MNKSSVIDFMACLQTDINNKQTETNEMLHKQDMHLRAAKRLRQLHDEDVDGQDAWVEHGHNSKWFQPWIDFLYASKDEQLIQIIKLSGVPQKYAQDCFFDGLSLELKDEMFETMCPHTKEMAL